MLLVMGVIAGVAVSLINWLIEDVVDRWIVGLGLFFIGAVWWTNVEVDKEHASQQVLFDAEMAEFRKNEQEALKKISLENTKVIHTPDKFWQYAVRSRLFNRSTIRINQAEMTIYVEDCESDKAVPKCVIVDEKKEYLYGVPAGQARDVLVNFIAKDKLHIEGKLRIRMVLTEVNLQGKPDWRDFF